MANILKSSGRVASITFNSAGSIISNAADLVATGSELISMQLNSLRDDAIAAREAAEDEGVKALKLRALKAEIMADALEEVYLQESRLAKIRGKFTSSGIKLDNVK